MSERKANIDSLGRIMDLEMAKVHILGGIDVYRLLPYISTSFDAISLSVSLLHFSYRGCYQE